MNLRALGMFGFSLTVLMMPVLSNAQGVVGGGSTPENRITILYDAFGKDASMRKDWGFSALVEIAGKRILFDTGDNRDIFAANVKAKNVDLTKLDFVVLSHRHGDHMAGLAHVLSVNPKVKIYTPKEGFGIYGSSLPSSFYRKAEALPPDMRYFDGKPPEVMTFGSAWQGANFELIDKTTEIVPGITLIALISEAPGTRELGIVARHQHAGWTCAGGRLFASRHRQDRRGCRNHKSQDPFDRRGVPPGCRVG